MTVLHGVQNCPKCLGETEYKWWKEYSWYPGLRKKDCSVHRNLWAVSPQTWDEKREMSGNPKHNSVHFKMKPRGAGDGSAGKGAAGAQNLDLVQGPPPPTHTVNKYM